MSVSKRVRFEVLRRDNHACQYCGSVAPDAILTIDHVIPVALGGSDDVGNLVAACRDCNAGKASISPDSPIVEAVTARSAEFALAQSNVAAHIRADMEAISEYADEFGEAWLVWGRGEGKERVPMPLPPDWRRTLRAWWRQSVPIELLLDSIPTAMTSKGKGQVGIADADRFRYFCGIVWRTLEEYDATYPVSTNAGHLYSADDLDAIVREQALAAVCATYLHIKANESARDALQHHIDGTEPPRFTVKTMGELAAAL